METTSVGTGLLWLLILLFPALLVTALCLCCRDLPGPNSEVPSNDSSHQTSSGLVIIKPRYTNTSWPSTWPPGQSDLPIPRSPQHPGLSHRIPSSRRDPDNRSEPSYENEEPEDADEEEEDYPNEGYLEVLPDGSPNSSSAPLSNSAPSLGNPGLRDSPSSMVSGEDYVNVPDSTEVSLGGSCEYVNVPEAQEERTPSSRTPVTDQDGEEEGPDYENVQEQSGYSFSERFPQPPLPPNSDPNRRPPPSHSWQPSGVSLPGPTSPSNHSPEPASSQELLFPQTLSCLPSSNHSCCLFFLI